MDRKMMLTFIRDCIGKSECEFCPRGVTCDDCIGTKARIWLDTQEGEGDKNEQ